MPLLTFGARAGGFLAAVTLVSSLTACAAEPELKFVSPTMAPVQTLAEACAISGEEVDRLTLETEQQIRDMVEQAKAELAGGKIPSLELLSLPLDDTLAQIEEQISNSEVHAAIEQVREAMRGFQDITPPESVIGVPEYLTSLGSQVNDLANAGKQLQTLCSTS